jgi:oxygen-independent coproporphyrinogen-3 oxidase
MTHRVLDPREVDAGLREKYDVRGPRYTSYPPAPHFAEQDPAALAARWRARNGLTDDPGLSLYLHVPFCRSRCLFCGCHTLGRRPDEQVDAHLDELEAEMALVNGVVDPTRPVRQVHLGGGTPNFLSVPQIHRLLGALERRFSLRPDAERSVEMEPRSATPAKIDAFLEHGFSRFSLGVQDFDPVVLEAVRRDQALVQVEEVVAHLRDRGVEEINFDLIYGLPGQTMASRDATLEEVRSLRPTRIALYSYAHVPWMQRHQQVLEGRGLPTPDEKVELFVGLAQGLVDAGYVPVGMDHFALPDDPLVEALEAHTLRRTFMGYTTGRGLDTVGMGISAISWVGSSYAQNHKDMGSWREAVRAGRMPWLRGFLLSTDDELRRELILELSCTMRSDLRALGARFGLDAEAYLAEELALLSPLEADGLVKLQPGMLEVTELGRLFVRNVCMVFDRYLERDPALRRYSRTV